MQFEHNPRLPVFRHITLKTYHHPPSKLQLEIRADFAYSVIIEFVAHFRSDSIRSKKAVDLLLGH